MSLSTNNTYQYELGKILMTHAHGPVYRENNFCPRRERSYFIKMKPLIIGVGGKYYSSDTT